MNDSGVINVLSNSPLSNEGVFKNYSWPTECKPNN